jgi:hypothetical protein
VTVSQKTPTDFAAQAHRQLLFFRFSARVALAFDDSQP